jgi:cyclase
VIASGGMGSAQDMVSAVCQGGADAVAMADVLHYRRIPLADIRKTGLAAGIHLRKP